MAPDWKHPAVGHHLYRSQWQVRKKCVDLEDLLVPYVYSTYVLVVEACLTVTLRATWNCKLPGKNMRHKVSSVQQVGFTRAKAIVRACARVRACVPS